MKMIPVHRGESEFEALVDDEDYEFVAQYRWRASVHSKTLIYANASVSTESGWKSVEMHRMVIGDFEEDWGRYFRRRSFVSALGNGKSVYHSSKI